MSDVLNVLADLVIILAGVVMTAAGWHWIANHTWRQWRESHLWRQADRDERKRRATEASAVVMSNAKRVQEAGNLPGPLPPPVVEPEPTLFIVYAMADGSMIGDEFSFVTDLEWFDDRDREERLMKRTYALVSEELLVLPDPYPIEDDEDDELPGPPVPPIA